MIESEFAARGRCLALVAIVAALVSVGCNRPISANPVVNGDMEQWPEGADASPASWRIAAGAGHFSQSDRIKHAGRSSVRLVLAAPNATVQQSVHQAGLTTDSLTSCSAWVHATRTKVRLHVSDG